MARVLYISHGHPDLSAGGAERAAYSLFREMRSFGFETFFLAAGPAEAGIFDGSIQVHRSRPDELLVFPPALYDFEFLTREPRKLRAALAAIVERLRPDVIHVHHFARFGVDLLSILRELVPEAKIVLTLHEYLLLCFNYGQMFTTSQQRCLVRTDVDCARCRPEFSAGQFFLRRKLFIEILKSIDVIHSPSHFLVSQFKKNLSEELPFVVAENIQVFRAVGKRNKGANNFVRVGYFGQINPFKGGQVLIAAIRELARRPKENGTRFFFEFYGSLNRAVDEAFASRFESDLNDLKEHCSFRGRYSGDEAVNLMSRMDIVVVPSIWWENSPLVIQEAITARVAIVASDIGGVKEKVAGLPNGFLFRAGDEFDLLDKILLAAESLQTISYAKPPSQDSLLKTYSAMYAH